MNSAQVLAFVAGLIERLPARRPLRVGIDGRSGAGKTSFADALAHRLEALGRPCLRASLDGLHPPGHEQPFPEEWLDVPAGAILLVDGTFLYTPALRGQWDFTIWLDVDWQVVLLRRARRDGMRGGRAELVREAYKTGWMQRQRHYEESIRPHEQVEVVIDNSDFEHPYIVRAPRPPRRAL